MEFDFLGKDSIRYNNSVPVEKRVYKNVQLFMDNKKGPDDLFDRLNTSILNEYLQGLMPGLTAKVFRTYNASITLQEQLNELTDENDSVTHKVRKKDGVRLRCFQFDAFARSGFRKATRHRLQKKRKDRKQSQNGNQNWKAPTEAGTEERRRRRRRRCK